jgi:hypothetical protein
LRPVLLQCEAGLAAKPIRIFAGEADEFTGGFDTHAVELDQMSAQRFDQCLEELGKPGQRPR